MCMVELTRNEIINILRDDTQNEKLFSYADEVRKKYKGDEVHLRGLIEFSNICKCNCKYCGLQSSNKKIERYRLSPDEIFLYAKNAVRSPTSCTRREPTWYPLTAWRNS